MTTNLIEISKQPNTVIGNSIGQEIIEKWVTATALQMRSGQWYGDFVKFTTTCTPMDQVDQLTNAPEGASIIIREHLKCDVVVTKREGIWWITDIQNRKI